MCALVFLKIRNTLVVFNAILRVALDKNKEDENRTNNDVKDKNVMKSKLKA